MTDETVRPASSVSRERIAIVGAGVAGLLAALSLARRGFEVTLNERAPAPQPAGAGIQLSPNAMRLLQDLGLYETLSPHLVRPAAIVVRDARDGSEIVRMPLHDAEERWGAPYCVIHRADLQDVLLDAAGKQAGLSLGFGTRFVGLSEADRRLTMTFDHGQGARTTDADIAIGADGLWSDVATAIARREPPTFARRWAWRATVPAAQLPAALRAPVTTLWSAGAPMSSTTRSAAATGSTWWPSSRKIARMEAGRSQARQRPSKRAWRAGLDTSWRRSPRSPIGEAGRSIIDRSRDPSPPAELRCWAMRRIRCYRS